MWGCSTDQMDRDNLEYNTDTYSDSDDILLPHTPPDTSTWGQLIGAANIMTKQSLMMCQGEEETGTPYKYSIASGLFMLCFAAVVTLLMKTNRY